MICTYILDQIREFAIIDMQAALHIINEMVASFSAKLVFVPLFLSQIF